LIKQKPGFSGKMFWTLEVPFKTGFTVFTINDAGILYGKLSFMRSVCQVKLSTCTGKATKYELGSQVKLYQMGRTVAQAVSRRLATAAARI
jgi:hypothetical protein